MTVSASTQIPKTSDPAVFQRQCKVLFEQVLKDPNVQEFGSSGQAQKGVDLLGRRRHLALDHWVGIQCKLTIKTDKLKRATVREEAETALTFNPKLKEYIIATTADDVSALHAEAAAFTDEQAKLGRDFTVQVWGWQTLGTHILQHEPAIDAFSPDAFPHLRGIARGQDRIIEYVESSATEQVAMLGILQRIDRQTASNASVAAGLAAWNDSSIGTLLDGQIDQYREVLTSGRPRTALGLLETLWANLPAGVEGRVRFRVRANIAACKLRLGDEMAAGNDYLEAYDHAPEDAKAVALKVLGLVLLGRPAQAREFGMASLGVSGDRGPLFAYLITAAGLLPEVEDAFPIIPKDLETDPTVEVARVDYLRFRPELGSWTRAAREASARHPDDKNLLRVAAEAEIADACASFEDNARKPLGHEILARVGSAVRDLQDEWGRVLRSEATWDDFTVSLCANLSTGYRLLQDADAARAVVTEGLQLVPDNQTLNERRFLIALEQNDLETAALLVERMPPSRDSVFGRLQISANTGDWSAIEALAHETDISTYEIDDKAYFESLTLLARFRLGRIDDPRPRVADLLQEFADQAIVPIVLHEIANHLKDQVWARELFEIALTRRATLNSASRRMLARIAEREDDAESVVDLLSDHVDTRYDSEDLRSLARGLANANPRRVAVDFIQSLPAALRATPFYSRVAGSIFFNSGALDEAAVAFREAVAASPDDLAAHLGLITTWLRQDRRDRIEEHLRKVDPAYLKGLPIQQMGLAQLLATFGRPEDGLALGYETALNHRDELRVAQLYIGLILPKPAGAHVPLVGPEVTVDCWVQLIREGNETLRVVIENGPDRPSIDHYGVSHSQDDVVTLTPPFGDGTIVAHRRYQAQVSRSPARHHGNASVPLPRREGLLSV